MPKKVLGILGSPCSEGNTATLLDAVLAGARDAGAAAKRVNISELDIAPCDACRECDSIGQCVHLKDDMRLIYNDIRKMDAIVLGSPIYFMGVSAQLKTMIDRCQCFWVERYVLHNRPYKGREHPKGLFVATAGSPKREIFEPAIHCVKAFFAAIDYAYAGEVLLGNTDDPEIGTMRIPVIERAFKTGRELVR